MSLGKRREFLPSSTVRKTVGAFWAGGRAAGVGLVCFGCESSGRRRVPNTHGLGRTSACMALMFFQEEMLNRLYITTTQSNKTVENR